MPAPTPLSCPPESNLVSWAHRHAAALYGPPEVIFVRGAGAWLVDQAGRRYLDFAGGMGVNLLGHAHPKIVAAIAAQAHNLLHTSNAFLSPGPLQLAKKLATVCHGGQSFFVNSGTEAVEGALKLARRYHHARGEPRHHVVACLRSFHGRTLGALSVTGQPAMHEGFAPLLPGVTFVPYDDLAATEAAVDERTCAVIVEPIQGNGGVRMPAANYLPALRQLTRRHGALLIHDEVQTGIGRTGAWLAADYDHVVPDILCLAKALGGGLPLGAVVAPKAIMDCFAQGAHGSTFGGNPVACAAALATFEVLEQDGLLPRAIALGEQLKTQLQQLAHVQQVRGRGLLWGLVVPTLDVAKLRQACLAHGLLTTQAGPDVLRLFVPAIATDDECATALASLQRALADAPQKMQA